MALDEHLVAASLAVLRSLRGKLAAIVERNPGSLVEQVALQIDSRPPVGYSGGLGGDDQYLTPENLSFANSALLLGAELPIILTLYAASEDRSPTTVGYSREHVGQLLTRVTRALGRLAGSAAKISGEPPKEEDRFWKPDYWKLSPGEELALQFGHGQAALESRAVPLFMVGTLAVVGVAGIIGLGAQAMSRSKTTASVTASQKVVRVGLVGTLLGAGAFAYFSGHGASAAPKGSR